MSEKKRLSEDIAHIEWFLIENYDVFTSFEKDGLDEYWFDPEDLDDPGVISINTSNDLKTQLFVLLHEAGHVLLRSDKKEFSLCFPDSSRDNIEGRIEILKEEVMAWLKAQELAFDLGIVVDQVQWQENYRNALLKYIEWVPKGDKNE